VNLFTEQVFLSSRFWKVFSRITGFVVYIRIISLRNVQKGVFMPMPIKYFQVGDRVEMKKKHPCGSLIWKVLRTGADVRMECEGCKHQVMLTRVKFEKGMKKVLDEKDNPC